MGPVTYVIAILGCADGSVACQPVATMPTRYESEASCSAATATTLAANSDFDFPTIVARCRPASAIPAAVKEPARNRDVPLLKG